MSERRSLCAGLLAVALLHLDPGVVRAQNTSTSAPAAGRHLKAGKVLITKGRPTDAAAQLDLAYRLATAAADATLRCEALELLAGIGPLGIAQAEVYASCPKRSAPPVAVPSDQASAPTSARRALMTFPTGRTGAGAAYEAGDFRRALGELGAPSGTPLHEILQHLAAAAEQIRALPTQATAHLEWALRLAGATAQGARLGTLPALMGGGRTRAAALLAHQLAEEVDPPIATLIVRLPPAFLAVRREYEARTLALQGQYPEALERARDLRALRPGDSAATHLFEAVRGLRVERLKRTATLMERRGDPDLALGFWYAATGAEQTQPDAKTAIARLSLRAQGFARLRVLVTPTRTPELIATQTTVRDLLRDSLGARVVFVRARTRDALVLEMEMEGPHRSFAATTSHGTKKIEAYTVKKPNPKWVEAADAYNAAVRDVGQAREIYGQLHDGGKQITQTPGGGLLSAALGAGAEVGGVAQLASAEGQLKTKSEALRATPKTITEKVSKEVRYPIVTVTATARAVVRMRLYGAGPKALAIEHPLVVENSVQEIPGSPNIAVPQRRADLEKLRTLAPDVRKHAAAISEPLVAILRSIYEGRLKEAVQRAQKSGSMDDQTVAYAYYLGCGGADTALRSRAMAFLSGRL